MASEKSNKFDGQKMALTIFESAMALFYLAFGVILLFAPLFHAVFKRAVINDGLRIALGVILSLYGVFRIYRSIKTFSRENNN